MFTKESFVALFSGTLFGLGLVISGMTQPQKVIGFLDLFGDWNPALAFVMGGAIAIHSLGFVFSKRMSSPLFHQTFHLPPKLMIDSKLIWGAVFFGLGWGIAGYCPGPAITSLIAFNMDIVIFWYL